MINDVPATRVLVLDDEAAMRKLFHTHLTEQGCVVQTAANARLALLALMRDPFDVIVADIVMEGMDGMVFLQEALKIWPWIGSVIVSGHFSKERREAAGALGITRLLEKPVSLDVLTAAVFAEGKEHRTKYEALGTDNSLTLMHNHLRLLQGLDTKVQRSETLIDILIEFGKTITDIIDADVVGILTDTEHPESRQLVMLTERAVNEDRIDTVRREMLSRYAILSGITIDNDSLRVQVIGAPVVDTATPELLSTLSVPIILGDSFCGLLTLATAQASAYSNPQVSLLYHAANHISAVFTALRQMHRLATRDHLTGLFNRIRLEEELKRSWLLSQRYKRPMSVIVVDIDDFKMLNDSFGHATGDEVLQNMATLLRGAARATDIVARCGGDEFVAVLPQADEHDAMILCERFMQRVRDTEFCKATHRLRVAASVGMASSWSDEPPETGDQLLSQADRALYMAKRAGRNRIAVWPGLKPAQGAEANATESASSVIKKRALVVDDEPTILELVKKMLATRGIAVTTCASAADAIQAVKDAPGFFDILLTDLSMPGKSGTDLLHELRDLDESIVKIVMTGYATVDTAVDCLREGAYDFIQKPLRMAELTALVQRALEYRNLKMENARYQDHLEQMVRKRGSQLVATLEEVRQSHDFTLEALVALLDARESQTGKHSVRARALTLALARQLNVEGAELDAMATGAFLHDIGKIGIPDAILLKPGPLSADEWQVMRTHCETGYKILKSSPYLKQAAELVYAHHEDFDGTGYPRGLKGSNICLGARIFAVVDAYDAMRSNRCYRSSIGCDATVEEIRASAGKRFDPAVVTAFLACQPELEEIFIQFS